MDGDRNYSTKGYHDSGKGSDPHRFERNSNHQGPKQQGPKQPIDITGPKLPRLVQNVAASRCFNCATTLAPDTDFAGKCFKCGADLHCCKQCVHFDSSTRFQCTKPIPARIVMKDQANSCQLFT